MCQLEFKSYCRILKVPSSLLLSPITSTSFVRLLLLPSRVINICIPKHFMCLCYGRYHFMMLNFRFSSYFFLFRLHYYSQSHLVFFFLCVSLFSWINWKKLVWLIYLFFFPFFAYLPSYALLYSVYVYSYFNVSLRMYIHIL